MAQHAFWIIVDGTTPTSFRSRQREDLVPTLTQLQRTQPQVTLMWFERGRLWLSPTEAREALGIQRKTRPGRTRDWRPGGEHADPRAKYIKTRDEKRARFKSRLGRDRSDAPPPPASPPGDPAAEHKPSRPPYRRPDRPEWRKPAGDRPFSDRPPRPRPPAGSGGYGRDRSTSGGGTGGARRDSRGPAPRSGEWRPNRDTRPPRPPRTEGRPPRPEGRPPEASDKPRPPKGFGDKPWRPKKAWQPGKPWRPKKPGGSGSR